MVDAWRVQDSTQPIDATAAISLLRSRLRSGRCETWFESDSGELLAVVTSGERAMVMLLREPGDAGEHAVDELKLVSSVIKGRERTPSKWRLDR